MRAKVKQYEEGEDGELAVDIRVLQGIRGPLDEAFRLVGDRMGSAVAYEDTTPEQASMRFLWHALHYVERRLTGHDELPDLANQARTDAIAWYTQAERFREDIKAREEAQGDG